MGPATDTDPEPRQRPTRRTASALLGALAVTSIGTSASAEAPAAPDPTRAAYDLSWRDMQRIEREHGRTADVNGVRLHYLEWGREGVPLIWAHGYSSTAFEMIQVGPALAEMGYHVIAITYRGHGETDLGRPEISLALIADDIATLMDQRGMTCAVVGGLSLGGAVATTFYENYPGRVLGIALEDGGAHVIQHKLEEDFTAGPTQPSTEVTAIDGAHVDRFDAYLQALAPVAQLVELRPETAAVIQSFVRQDEAGLWRFHVRHDHLLGSGPATLDPARSRELPLLAQSWRRVHPLITYRNLRVPMLIIDPTGDDADPALALSADYAQLTALHPDLIAHVEYPDTGHIAHPVRPEWFLRDMNTLLARVKNGSSPRPSTC